MSTIWDHAVRALHPLLGDLPPLHPPLPSPSPEGGSAYFCGGPQRRCSHATCAAVSALAAADLLNYPAYTETSMLIPAVGQPAGSRCTGETS